VPVRALTTALKGSNAVNRVYRLVFNRTLGVMQVASELVTAPRGGCDARGGNTVATPRPVSFALWLALGWVGVVQPLSAQQSPNAGRIIADPNAPADQRPTVVGSANGTPQVNITTPSAAGVSRNQYQQFDVGAQGVILNNSRGDTQTQIGGWVQGNPWLATGTARVILNEINSSSPSQLNGYIEVAGARAQVIIANPAGIQIDGAGFLNASRVTLTTGTPIVSNGALEGYRVAGGAIRIAGAGLDASRTDYTDIITRSLQVNAGIWANQLQASLGNNVVSADNTAVTPQAAGSGAPAFALDVGALGGMYANRIWLVGNEQGVGMRNAGKIGAQAGELVVTAEGRLENTGALHAQQDTRIKAAGGVANAGTLSAERELRVDTPADIDNSGGTLNARRLELNADALRNRAGSIEQVGAQALQLKGADVRNLQGQIGTVATTTPGEGTGNTGGTAPGSGSTPGTGTGIPTPGTGTTPPPATTVPLAAGVLNIARTLDNDGGAIDATGVLQLDARSSLDNSGGTLGVDTLKVQGQALRNVGGTLEVQGATTARVATLDNSDGHMTLAQGAELHTQTLLNRGGSLAHGGSAASAWTIGMLDNRDGSIASNAASFGLGIGTLVNTRGSISHAGSDGLRLRADRLDGVGGTLATAGDLLLQLGTADHRNAQLIANQVSLTAASFDNRGGRVLATGQQASSLNVQGTLDNGDGGTVASNGDLQISAAQLGNAGGTVQQAGSGSLRIDAATLQGQGGSVLSNGSLLLQGGTTNLRDGTTAAQRIDIHTNDLVTAGGSLTSAGPDALNLQVSRTLDNTGGLLGSNGALAIQATTLINNGGKLVAAGTGASTLRASGLLQNQGGTLSSNGDLRIDADGLLNAGGSIDHAGNGTLQITANAVQGSAGSIASNGLLQLQAQALDVRKGSTRARQVDIRAGSLDNSNGTLLSLGEQALQLSVSGALLNDGGTLSANGAQQIEAGSLSNRSGALTSAGTADSRIVVAGTLDNHAGSVASNAAALRLQTGTLVNADGAISHAGTGGLSISTGRLDGQDGHIGTAGAVTLSAGAVDHRGASLAAAQLDLTAQSLDNRGGSIVATGTAANTVQVADTLDNGDGGSLASNGDLSISAQTLVNAGGSIQQAGSGTLAIEVARLDGTAGSLLSNGTLQLRGDTLDLGRGTTSAQQIQIDSERLVTAGGQLSALGTGVLQVQARTLLDNSGGTFGSNGAVNIAAGTFTNDHGKLIAAGEAASQIRVANLLDNSGGAISGNGSLHIDTATLRNAGGSVVAGDALQLQGEELDLRDGAVGATQVTVQAGSLDNSGGSLNATGTADMLLQVRDRLGNDDGTIASNGAQRIEAGTLSNRDGTLSSAGTANSQITVSGELDNSQGLIASNAGALAVSAGSLSNEKGTLNHAGTGGLTVDTGTLDGRDGAIVTAGDLALSATTVDHRGATLQAAQIALDARSFDNRGGKLVATGTGANRLTVQDTLDNGGQGLIASNGDLAINAATFGNAGGTVQQAGSGLLDITADRVLGADGTLVSNGSLTVQADDIDLRDGTTSAQRIRIDGGTVTTAGGTLTATSTDALVLYARGQLDNSGGIVAGNGTLDLRAGALLNNAGTVQAAGTGASQLQIDQALHNRSGKILTSGDLAITASSLDNQGGTLHSAADLRVGVDGLLDNSNAGLVASAGDADISAGTLDNRSGAIEQAGDGQLQINVQTLQGAAGRIVSNGALNLEGETLDISGGTTAARDIKVIAGSLQNAGGTLSATGEQAMVLQVRDALGNNGGTIAANGAQQISAGALSNVGGTLSSAGSADTRIDVTGQFDNSRGTVASNANALQVNAGSLINEAGRIAHAGDGGLTLHTGSLLGQQGSIATTGALTLRAGEVDHRNATLSANQLDIVATGFDNRGGTVVSGGTGPSTVSVQGSLDNGNNGTLASNGDLQITAATFGNAGGTVQHAGSGTLAINAHTLNGQGGKLLSNGTLQLLGESTDLRNGTTAAQRIRIQTGDLITAGGTLTAAGTEALALDVRGRLDNTAGTLATNGTLDLRAAHLFNNQGTVQAAGTGGHQLTLGGALENRGGRILTGGATTVTAGSVDNRAGILHTDGSAPLTLTVDGLLDNSAQGTINAGGSADIRAQSLNNTAGILAAGAVLQLDTATRLANAGGLIQAGTDLHLGAAGIDNQAGRIIAGTLELDTRGQALDNRGGTIASLTGGGVLRTGLLDNTGGLLQTAGNLRIDTAGQALINANANGNGINSSGTLDITSGAFDNRAGAVFGQGAITLNASSVDNAGGSLQGAGDLTLRVQALNNAGGAISVGGNADIALPGALDNRSGLVAAAGTLTVQAASVDNRNTLSAPNGPALGLQGKQLQLTSGSLVNQQGQVLADNLTLQLGGLLDNTGGQVSASETSDISADSIANGGGTLVAGTHQIIRTREITGDGRVLSQGDMTLELRQSYTNTSELAANGTLTLAIQGNLDNLGKLQGANVNISAGNVYNAATGEISSVGLTRLVAAGELVNRGLLDGRTTHVDAGTLVNIGTGRIYGDHIAINAGTLNNQAENVGGVQRSATIAARQRLDLGVGVLSNTGQSLVFSDGDAAIGGGLNGLNAVGAAQRIDNLSSTIEIAGNLDINALAVNNIRENVVVQQQTTRHAPVTLNQPEWFKNGNNTGSLRNTSNFQPYEVYYLNPADILEDSAYITPDGQQIRRAVVKMTPNTSAYYFARGGLYGARGERARLDVQGGTMVIYYVLRADNRNNPDQLGAGAEDPFRDLSTSQPGSPAFHYESDNLTYSNAYGTCTTTCVQLITYPDYDNPDAMLINMQRHPENTSGNEERRVATRTTVEDVVVSAGSDAVINAGGNMRITTDALRNEYASIAAGGDFATFGITQDASVTNIAKTLYRTHSFFNESYTYNKSKTTWSAAPISEQTGVLGSGILAGGKLTIDVGNLRNENTGRDAPNVRDGDSMANLNTGGPGAGSVGPGAGAVQGPGQSAGQGAGPVSAQGPNAAAAAQGQNGTAVQGPGNAHAQLADTATAQGPGQVGSAGPGGSGVQDISAVQAGQATATGPTAAQGGNHAGSGANAALDRKQAVAAAGNDPHLVVTTAPNASAPSASLFNVDANRGTYLVETDPKFANYRSWLSSDYLLQRAGYEPSQTQKRLGDGFYEQKLVREQIGELTGRRFLDGYGSDEDQYRALLEAGATVAGEWGLRPGVALTAEQMARLTSDIVWLVEQDVTLADGSVARALVPQVYLRVMPGDLDHNGALLAGADVDIKLRGDLVSNGSIAGRQLVSIDAGNIRNIGGGQISGQQVGLKASGNIDIIGSTVTATDVLALKAGGDITVASTTRDWQDNGDLLTQRTTTLDRVAGLYVTNTDGAGVLSVNAGGNVELRAARLANAGADGLTAIVAGGDINLTSVVEQRSVSLTHDARNFSNQSQLTHTGTTITGAGDVVLNAGRDLNLAAANVSAANALVAQAGRDINSVAVVDTQTFESGAKSRNHSREVTAASGWVLGNQLSGGEGVALQAGRDLTLQSTTVDSSDGGVVLSAGRNVALTTAQETHDLVVDETTRKKKTLSSTTTTTHEQSAASYAVGSSVGGKSVDIIAGNDVSITGSTVLADNDLRIAAVNNITIESAQDTLSEASSFSQKKSGITGGFANGVASVGYSSARSNNESASQSTTQVGSAVGSMDGNVQLNAGNQLTIAASDVAAGQDLTLIGKDINLVARQDTLDTQNSQSSKSSGLSMGVTYDPTKAYRSARDSTTDGMADSGSIMGDITRNAEGTASGVRAATTSVVVTGGSQRSSGNQTHSTSDARVAQLSAGGDMTLIANGGSITSQGAQLSAEGDALLLATKDIVFDVAHNTESSTSQSAGKGWGFANNTSGLPFGTNNSRSDGTGQSDTITGTQLSVGGGVRMATTEGDISLTAANIAAEKDVTIRAAGNLTVQSGQDTVSNANTADSKAIGTVQISDTEKFAGWHRQQHEDDSGMVSQVASTIGSLGGNVNLGAGGKYTQIASNVVAAQDVNITAAEIELLTADESGHNSQSDKDLKIGVFARIKSPFIDLINNVDSARQSDGRLQAMQGMAAGANAYQAASAISAAAGGAGSGSLFSAEAGIGFKSSSSSAEGSSTVSRGSTIQGGGNVNLTSTSGDIHVVQGNLSAGNTLALDSAGDILLEAGKAHLQDKSRSNNAGAEVGVGVSVGAQTGVYVYAEASVGSSKSNADSSTWQNTTLTGQNISLKAEGDTTLRGATATADRIDVKTGGTLTIESLQDVAESMSKDSQVGGRVQVSVGTAWDASGYASAGKANGSYKGVGQQSGLFAGDGGYHVDAGHVNLVGGAIASTNAANSELTAQSLTFTDLKNEMDYRASSASISGGFGNKGTGEGADKNAAGQLKDIGTNVAGGKFGSADGTNFSGGVPMTSSGSDSSTTYATLTEGNITIGGKKVTAAELGVNTDASKAHEAISTLPDLQKLMQEQQAMSLAAGTVVATSKQVAGDVFAYKSEQAKQAFEENLKNNNAEEWANYSKLDSNGKAGYLQNASQEYREALKWGTGGEYSRALDAVTTAIVGNVAGQGGGQVVSNALAPYAAALIGDRFDTNHGKDPDAVLQLLSHAVLGALLAEANGGSPGNGALAAGAGEIAAQYIADYLYPAGLSNLTEQQKQTVLALSQAVGAIAGGAGGNGLAGAALGSNIAQNSVENNRLLHPSEVKFLAKKETVDSYIAFMASHGVVLTAEEARSSLNRFASSKEDNSWSAILGQDPLTSEFLSSMSKGLTYQDSTGKSHAFFVSSATELKDPTINLNALYDARFDPVVAQYLDSIGANNRQPTDLNRELFGYGQLAGYSYADGQASAWGDIKLIANSMVSFGQSVLYSGTSDQVGPYDELKLKANLQLLLKDQGRWAEAGFVEGAEWATTQRLMWSGMALGEAGGFLGGNLIKLVKLPAKAATDLAKNKNTPPIASWVADSEAGTSIPVSKDHPATSTVAKDGLLNELLAAQRSDPRIGTTLPGANASVVVTAESTIGGRTLFDTNQTARPSELADGSKRTLISDTVPPGDPNSTMANAHAEIGLIQQAFDAGLTRGQNMSIVVRGEAVCSYCQSNLSTAAERSGLNSLQVVDTVRGRVFLWIRGRGWVE